MGGSLSATSTARAITDYGGKWADDPLCEQFAFAVHALEVLKGDGSRGTTLPIVAQDGTRFDLLPNFRFRMRPTVERPGGGFRITATDASAFPKIEKQISAVADFASGQSEVRSYQFVAPVSTHGSGLRGILKAALHFVVAATTDKRWAKGRLPADGGFTFRRRRSRKRVGRSLWNHRPPQRGSST